MDNKISQFTIIFKSSAAKCNKYNVQQKKTSKISRISFIYSEHSHLESAMKNILNKQSEGILIF